MARTKKLKLKDYGGIILSFEPERSETIKEFLAIGNTVSESFSSQDWNLQSREMIYLASQGEHPSIFGAALMLKRGGGGGTKRVNMRFSEPVLFDSPIFGYEAADPEVLKLAISTSNNIKRFDAAAWRKLNDLIKMLRPEQEPRLDEIARLREANSVAIPHDTRTARLSEERDALGLALDVAGLDRYEILREVSYERIDAAKSVLDLIDAQPIAESSLIERDAERLKIALTGTLATGRFNDARGREVRAYVLDKTTLETATGVDLLLYQEQYHSFLLLQYKAMEKDRTVKGWSYSVNGSNLVAQLETMRNIRAVLPLQEPQTLRDHRLCVEPFYFKFCERRALQASDEGLAAGITMSAPHLAHFLTLPDAKLQGHGPRVGYENCPRYINNTEFVSLARGGWIGCQGVTTDAITNILAARKHGRIAILAVIKGLQLSAQNRKRMAR